MFEDDMNDEGSLSEYEKNWLISFLIWTLLMAFVVVAAGVALYLVSGGVFKINSLTISIETLVCLVLSFKTFPWRRHR